MIKLLIADDEHIVLESLKFIIEKYVAGVEVVAAAKSGREAIEKALDLKPDAIFMDIHMPGINGMDAIRHIKSVNPDTLVVIITAYEYFQYAKDAVNLGVSEYLLKPLNKNKVIKTLENISDVVYSKKEAIQREMILREKIGKILPHMEGQFIYSQLFHGNTVKDIAFYQDIFGMEINHGYVMMALIEDFEGVLGEEGLRNSLMKQQFYDIFHLELKNLCPCLIGPPLIDRIVAYVPESENSYEIRNKSIEYGKKIMDKIKKSLKISYKIGIGRSYDIGCFSQSANEAYIAATLGKEQEVFHFQDVHLSPFVVNTYPANKDKILIHKILTGDIEGSLEVFEEIFLWMSLNYKQDIDRIKSKLIELLISIQGTVPHCKEEKGVLQDDYLMQLLKINNIRGLKFSYLSYLKSVITYLQVSKEKELKGLITKAVKYIEENFHENISLDEVAKEINMSYHYFSKFFKESMGKNFVDYLTELRVDKSKEILRDATINVKEICYKVGYSDPNYFSKIFKKSTGMTPTEYRNNILSQEVIG